MTVMSTQDESEQLRGRPIQRNRLNDLYSKEWLKFQKSWFVHNPPRRRKGVIRHPAKFPETLVEEFIRFFTKAGETVLDPMAGTGSTVVAAARAGRVGIGIELQEEYAEIGRQWLAEELEALEGPGSEGSRIITGDARDLGKLGLPPVDYCITSPPYWDMLRVKGWKTQKQRAQNESLDVYYSDDERDLGNIEDYDEFVALTVGIYREVAAAMRSGAYLTVIVKNVKKGPTIYPLAWDLGKAVGEFLKLKDERIWCQDDQRLSPFGMGNCWVSNTMHQYCLNFRKE
ncbi:MAG: DNA methyltransferase [Armatimonadia bacterium]